MKKYIILVIITSSFFSYLFAQDSFAIKDVSMTGMKSISEAKVKKELTLQEKSFWGKILFWKKANNYYEADLISDLAVIENFYQKEGFLDVEVDSEINENSEEQTVEIEFIIQENKAVLIEEINYQLKAPESEDSAKLQASMEQLTQDFPLKKAARFRDKDLLETKSELENWLAKQGYAYKEVSYDLQVKRETNQVVVNFTLNTGQLSYFGEATFKGVEKVPYSILEKQLAPPGKVYSEVYLQTLQRRLQSLGMFQYVTVSSVLDEEETNPIPIQINLKEASRLSFKYGIGYGQEDKFRTSITATKLGFLGGIRKAVFFAKYSSLEPYNLSLKLTQPAIFHPNGALTLNPFVRKEDETSYSRSRIGSFVIYQIGFGRYVNSYLNYGLEWNKLKTDSPSLEDELISEGKGNYRQSSATIGAVYDDSQPMFSAVSGWYLSSAFTWVGIGFNSDYHYTMTTSEIRKYTSIYEQLVLASRIKGGFMKSLRADEVTPIADRFYSGGSTSVRGWAYSDLGPKSEDDLSLGGNSTIEASVEIRYPIWNIVSGVVFCDAGNVWEGTYSHNLSELEYAGGAGLRIATPLGPVRFDIARPISQSNKKLQYYLNIGEAF